MKENILKLLNDVLNVEDENIEKLDLTKDEDYEKFNNYVDECKKICDNKEDLSCGLSKLLFDTMFGFDMSELIDEIKEIGDKVHAEAKKKEEKKKIPELPSKKTSMETQANLHKIVGEYVDTYIRPYGNMDRKVVDDVYAGLFEFACWVMNR